MDATQLTRAVNATLMPGFAGPDLPGWLATELEQGLGSVCLFSTNIVDAEQLRTLTAAIHSANPHAVIATDEEGGDVTRLHHRDGSPYPSMAYLGHLDDPAITEQVGAGIGAQLAAAGIDLNLAPVADVNSNPRNPVIGVRSFGATPDLVARQVAPYVRGLQSAGAAACAKHFPGHGDTATDSHLALPTITVDRETLTARELVPFVAAVEAGSLAIMTSHILVPAIDPDMPATLSSRVLSVLRDRLGFTGAIVSDALDMAGASAGRGIPEAAVLALAAGVDLLCIGTDNSAVQLAEIRDHVLAAVHAGRLPAQRVLDAAETVAALAGGVSALRASAPALSPAPPALSTDGFVITRPISAVVAPVAIRLDSADNIAAGDTVWGIADHLRPVLDEVLPGSTCVTVDTERGLRQALDDAEGRPVLLQGRDLDRVPFLREAVRAAIDRRPDAVVVELGWPDPARSPHIDIATLGSGRGAMICLIRLLAQGS
ncbi:MAG TPA: glycoside hydrolase family 3 N-terminal domain-containing protein [Micropruina sp.]|nr:glycoside hydrolase family 3 N-terminal domain-containing protein [Micropruina sp.]